MIREFLKMKVRTFFFWVSFLVFLGSAWPFCLVFAGSYEDTFRCGTDLIVLGDSNLRVRAKCGTPNAKDYVGKNYLPSQPAGEVRDVEEWTYNRGPTDFVYTLKFQGGALYEIYRGGRGF